MSLQTMKYAEFLNYLERAADEFDECGMETTSEDYRECIRRFEDLCDRLNDIETQVSKSNEDLDI